MAWLKGTSGNDKLIDKLGVDHIRGFGGNDRIKGLGGNDWIETGPGNDRAFGGDGFDFFSEEATKKDAGIRVRNLFDGGDGYDELNLILDKGFSAKNDVVKVNVGAGTVRVTHHDYLDTIHNIEAFSFDTKLRVVIYGGDEFETFRGGAGNDRIYGNGGMDVLYGRAGRDVLHGNGGDDRLFGGAGKDELLGGKGADALDGGANDDILRGGAGSDALYGGRGTDVLYGGADADADTFVFHSVLDSNPSLQDLDVIHQFTPGTDKIDLSQIDANTHTGGDQSFTFNGTGGGAPYAVWYKHNGPDLEVYADNDGDGTADLGIYLMNVSALSASDFHL